MTSRCRTASVNSISRRVPASATDACVANSSPKISVSAVKAFGSRAKTDSVPRLRSPTDRPNERQLRMPSPVTWALKSGHRGVCREVVDADDVSAVLQGVEARTLLQLGLQIVDLGS